MTEMWHWADSRGVGGKPKYVASSDQAESKSDSGWGFG